MANLKIGMIGCGWIRTAHMSGINDETPEIEVTAACDLFPDTLNRFCDRHGIEQRFSDPAEMFEKAGLDAVSIAVKPEGDKVTLAIKAMEAGLHVLAEKPMALTVKEAEAMADASRKTGKVLQIGYNRRFEPIYARAKELLDDKDSFGDVASMDTAFSTKSPCPYVCFMSQNPHSLDLLQYLGGRVSKIRTVTRKTFDQAALDEFMENMHPSEAQYANTEPGLVAISAASTLEFESGAVGTFRLDTHSSATRTLADRFEIFGTNDSAVLIDSADSMTVCRSDGAEEMFSNKSWGRKVSSFGLEYRHFMEWIESGKPSVISLEDAVASTYLYEGFIRSLQTEDAIDLINWKE